MSEEDKDRKKRKRKKNTQKSAEKKCGKKCEKKKRKELVRVWKYQKEWEFKEVRRGVETCLERRKKKR